MSQQTDSFPMPWEHTIKMRVAKTYPEVQGGELVEVDHIEAYCTCLQYNQVWSADEDALRIAEHASDHLSNHPAEPMSVCQLGDESFVIVMAVPGPRPDEPVHMSIAVSKETFFDGQALMRHLGPIGSSVHFKLDQHRKFHAGFDMQVLKVDPRQMPGGVQSIIEMLREKARENREEG